MKTRFRLIGRGIRGGLFYYVDTHNGVHIGQPCRKRFYQFEKPSVNSSVTVLKRITWDSVGFCLNSSKTVSFYMRKSGKNRPILTSHVVKILIHGKFRC